MKNKIALLAASFLISTFSHAAVLKVGEKAPLIKVSGDLGGLVKDGSEFKTDDIAGKMQIIWYVDPDEKDLNNYATEKLRAKGYPKETVGSVAIINFAATMVPNWILGGIIEDSQKENKNTLYVKDLKKSFVKEWGLKDDSSNVIVLSKDLKVIYWYGGKLDEKETEKFLATVDKALGK